MQNMYMSLPMLNPKYLIFKGIWIKKLAHFSNRQLFSLKEDPL